MQAEGASWITITGMILQALNAALAATLVYFVARDKLRFDAEMLKRDNRIAELEKELSRKGSLGI